MTTVVAALLLTVQTFAQSPGAIVAVGGGGTTENRLLGAVLDNPKMIGVGIDEATAAILHDGRLEVVGRSAVVVFDARRASVQPSEPGEPVSGTGVMTSVLREGTTLSLDDR